MNNQRNFFLDEVGKHLHKLRPRVPEGLYTTTYTEQDNDKTFADIYIRSKGCHHNYLGGCTMCDYWVSDDFDNSEMSIYGQKALNELNFKPSLLVFGPSGSIFDDWEVPPEVRINFYKKLQKTNATLTGLFSRVETITESKLAELAHFLDPNKVSIEMGLETSDPWKSRYCINKAIDVEKITETVTLIRRFGFKSSVYILVGVPFLSVSEAIEDAVKSVLWAFDQGVEYCVVFPMHIKPWTVVYWCYEQHLYQPFSLWSLSEVLSRFEPTLLKRIGICWHRPRPAQSHPLYNIPSIPPTTCPNCSENILRLLDSYRFSQDRAQIVKSLMSYECECRNLWAKEMLKTPNLSLEQRVKQAYEKMGRSILGDEWWMVNGDKVIRSILTS